MLKKVSGVAVVVFFVSVNYVNAMCLMGLLGKGHENGHDTKQEQTDHMKGDDTSANMHNSNESTPHDRQCGEMGHSTGTHNEGSGSHSDQVKKDSDNLDETGGY